MCRQLDTGILLAWVLLVSLQWGPRQFFLIQRWHPGFKRARKRPFCDCAWRHLPIRAVTRTGQHWEVGRGRLNFNHSQVIGMWTFMSDQAAPDSPRTVLLCISIVSNECSQFELTAGYEAYRAQRCQSTIEYS